MSVTPELPRIPDPGSQRETAQFQEPSGSRRDLIAFLAVLGLAVTVLIFCYVAGGAAAAGMYGVPTVVVMCFGTWRALRRREAPRRWQAGTVTFCSKNNRLKFARSWGTEGAEAPALPCGTGEQPKPQNATAGP